MYHEYPLSPKFRRRLVQIGKFEGCQKTGRRIPVFDQKRLIFLRPRNQTMLTRVLLLAGLSGVAAFSSMSTLPTHASSRASAVSCDPPPPADPHCTFPHRLPRSASLHDPRNPFLHQREGTTPGRVTPILEGWHAGHKLQTPSTQQSVPTVQQSHSDSRMGFEDHTEPLASKLLNSKP